jgi:RimJ/RimL family protein N-acetyltransferase
VSAPRSPLPLAGTSTWAVQVAWAASRFYLRPVRRAFDQAHDPGRTWQVRLGPQPVLGHRIVLRSPRLRDADQWRAVRTRERERIEPWWVSSDLSWEQRHTTAQWTRDVLQFRREARAGRALPLVVEIDGQLGGQCNLEWIAPHTATAEMGIWMDSRWARQGLSAVGAGMMVDYAMTVLGLQRLIAPIGEGNVVAAAGARRIGMRLEGTMAGFLDVGGVRRNHDLWAFTAECLPAGGLTAAMLRSALQPRSTEAPGVARSVRMGRSSGGGPGSHVL